MRKEGEIGYLESSDINFDMYDPEDTLGMYIAEIRRIPPLNIEEEKKLFSKDSMSSTDKERIYCSKLALVITIATKMTGRGVEILDLIEEGNRGLLDALDRYDNKKGSRFSTYAYYYIKGYMHKAIIKERLGGIYIDDLLENDEKRTLFDITPDPNGVDPENQSEYDYLRDKFNRLSESINKPNWRAIFQLKYGFRDGVPYSYTEISEILGINRSRVEQIDKKLLEKIRIEINGYDLKQFLNTTKEKTNGHDSNKGENFVYTAGFLFAVKKMRNRFGSKTDNTSQFEIDSIPGISELEKTIYDLKYNKFLSNKEIRLQLHMTENAYIKHLNSMFVKIRVFDEDQRFERSIKQQKKQLFKGDTFVYVNNLNKYFGDLGKNRTSISSLEGICSIR